MKTLHLRELVANGFCGGKTLERAHESPGYLATIVDHIARSHLSSFRVLEDESVRISLASQYAIPYSEAPLFNDLLQGLKRELLNIRSSGRLIPTQIRVTLPSDLVIEGLALESDETYHELSYDYYFNESGYIPIYSLCAAYLKSLMLAQSAPTSVTVAVHHVLSGRQIPARAYHLNVEWIGDLILQVGSEGPTVYRPGPQCMGCSATQCHMYDADAFSKLIQRWMKAKGEEDAREAEIRNHLVQHGPAKSGTHLFFMDEHQRRYFVKSARFDEFLTELITHCPKGYHKFLNPDAGAVFEAVERKELPESILRFFKQRSYFTINSQFSPELHT